MINGHHMVTKEFSNLSLKWKKMKLLRNRVKKQKKKKGFVDLCDNKLKNISGKIRCQKNRTNSNTKFLMIIII